MCKKNDKESPMKPKILSKNGSLALLDIKNIIRAIGNCEKKVFRNESIYLY